LEDPQLNTPLIQFTGQSTGHASWTVRNAFEGVQIFGGIGSGKTSGSGRMLALKFLQNGFGGLVLTAKPDEKKLWTEYCALANRSDDLLVIEPNGDKYFNFLEYESKDGSLTENIVQVLKTVINASEEKSGGKGADPFWENALDMLIFNVIDLCKLAYDKVSVQHMYGIVQSLPKPDTEYNEEHLSDYEIAYEAARDNVNKQIERWEAEQDPTYLNKILKNEAVYDEAVMAALPDGRTLKFIDEFFEETFKNLSDKTRSIIELSFSGFLFRLLRDPVYSLFCSKASNTTPEDSLSGKIIIINLPVKTYHKIGRDSQILFKYIWQRAMEKRDVSTNGLPVFLWADEAQNFLHEHDAEYQATARSSRISTVYLSQNLPNYHANMSGGKSEYQVKGFLGTLATKIFHANADIETNRYSSDLIGDTFFEEISKTATAAGKFSSGQTKSIKIDRAVRPEDFVRLRTGSPKNNYKVEAYIHVQGDAFVDGQNFCKIAFDQRYGEI
jgi:type IV secretory pathway TraG/TraD family ATPase VirD4